MSCYCHRAFSSAPGQEQVQELVLDYRQAACYLIYEKALQRDVERSGKALVPTEKGLYIYEAVKDMHVANVELTGSWVKRT